MSPEQKYSITDKNSLQWAEGHSAVLTYLNKINACKERAATDIYLFSEWAGKTPEELLAMKTGYENLDVEKLLDKFAYSKVDLQDTRKWQIIQKVRGFFRANYKALASGAGKMEYPPGGTRNTPPKQKRRLFYESCYNPRDKAIVAVVGCSAMALETLSELRWSHFEEGWQDQEIPHVSLSADMLKGHGQGKYRGVRQETFLTPEAKRVLLEYRDWYTKTFGRDWAEDDYVFLQTKRGIGEPLNYLQIAKIMRKLSKRSGVTWRSHDGRRIVQTALESVGTSSNWIKKIKGRKVSGEDAPYSRPAIEQLRQKYREALPELEFLSEPTVDMERLEEMEQKLSEKDQVIEALAKNGAELKAKVYKIESSKESIALLLQKVIELEKRLEEQKNA